MNKTIRVLFTIFILIILACSPHRSNKPICELKQIKTLFTIPSVYEGKITGYAHYILIKDFDRKCMDSATMVNISLKYIDTVNVGRPGDVIKLFSTDKDFIPNETSQVMEEINKNCLVSFLFDKNTKQPKEFLFYNNKGEIIYWGDRWKPNGK